MSDFLPGIGDPVDEPRPERPRRTRQQRRWLPVLLTAVGLVGVVGLIGGTLYAVTIDRAVNQNLRRSDTLPAETPAAKGEQPRPQKKRAAAGEAEAMNYVLMGSDSRASGNPAAGRSDVLMVMHLAADRRNAYVVSFPRDMWVPIPGHGRNKINAAFAFGGPQLTVRTLEGLLDTRMDHVALIDFDGFVQLTEELGGVTVYNKHRSVSGGYTFPVGYVTVRGDQALAYVRERKQLPRGDLDRAERQRAVLQALLAKGLSRDTVASPRKFLSFTAGIAQHVTVDSALTDDVLRETALSLRLTPKDIASLQAPISGFGTTADGQSIDVVDQQKLTELAEALQKDTMADYVRRYPNG